MIEARLALPLRLRVDDLGNLNVTCFLDCLLRLSAECIERLFFVEIVLDGLFLWMTCDSPNQLKNAKVFGTFHRFFRNARDIEVNIRIVRRKIKLVHIITTFGDDSFLALCAVPPLFQVSLSYRDFGHVVLPLSRVSPFCRKNLILLATH